MVTDVLLYMLTTQLEKISSRRMDSATFQFHSEDHTLGNALRYMLAKKPTVQFAGYCVPHPSEPVMNVRVQCEEQTRSENVVDEALQDLSAVFGTISTAFEKSLADHMRML
jgi:DNA-directed RNA polymerases I and III subunit RPAC2